METGENSKIVKFQGQPFNYFITNPDCSLLSAVLEKSNVDYGWKETNNCCSFSRVKCVMADGSTPTNLTTLSTKISEIYFNNVVISGPLDPSICGLTNLKVIQFSNNTGLVGSIPQCIGSLIFLEKLYFSSTSISGSIPPGISRLKSLKVLAIQNTKIVSNIPNEIASLTSLTHLYLDGNPGLSGEIPASLAGLSQLLEFHAYDTSLSGSIPSSIGNLRQLQSLVLYNTNIQGNLPDSIENLVQLQTLKLQNTKMSGVLTEKLGQLTNLKTLRLDNTQLTGAFPSPFYSTYFMECDLSSTKLCMIDEMADQGLRSTAKCVSTLPLCSTLTPSTSILNNTTNPNILDLGDEKGVTTSLNHFTTIKVILSILAAFGVIGIIVGLIVKYKEKKNKFSSVNSSKSAYTTTFYDKDLNGGPPTWYNTMENTTTKTLNTSYSTQDSNTLTGIENVNKNAPKVNPVYDFTTTSPLDNCGMIGTEAQVPLKSILANKNLPSPPQSPTTVTPINYNNIGHNANNAFGGNKTFHYIHLGKQKFTKQLKMGMGSLKRNVQNKINYMELNNNHSNHTKNPYTNVQSTYLIHSDSVMDYNIMGMANTIQKTKNLNDETKGLTKDHEGNGNDERDDDEEEDDEVKTVYYPDINGTIVNLYDSHQVNPNYYKQTAVKNAPPPSIPNTKPIKLGPEVSVNTTLQINTNEPTTGFVNTRHYNTKMTSPTTTAAPLNTIKDFSNKVNNPYDDFENYTTTTTTTTSETSNSYRDKMLSSVSSIPPTPPTETKMVLMCKEAQEELRLFKQKNINGGGKENGGYNYTTNTMTSEFDFLKNVPLEGQTTTLKYNPAIAIDSTTLTHAQDFTDIPLNNEKKLPMAISSQSNLAYLLKSQFTPNEDKYVSMATSTTTTTRSIDINEKILELKNCSFNEININMNRNTADTGKTESTTSFTKLDKELLSNVNSMYLNKNKSTITTTTEESDKVTKTEANNSSLFSFSNLPDLQIQEYYKQLELSMNEESTVLDKTISSTPKLASDNTNITYTSQSSLNSPSETKGKTNDILNEGGRGDYTLSISPSVAEAAKKTWNVHSFLSSTESNDKYKSISAISPISSIPSTRYTGSTNYNSTNTNSTTNYSVQTNSLLSSQKYNSKSRYTNGSNAILDNFKNRISSVKTTSLLSDMSELSSIDTIGSISSLSFTDIEKDI